MICNKCGNEISSESKFCPECGAKLNPQISKKSRKYLIITATIVVFVFVLLSILNNIGGVSKDGAVEIEKAKFTYDLYSYDAILIVVYNYKNTTDNAASFAEFCTTRAYQDGIECKSTLANTYGFENYQEYNKVQSGHSYQLFMAYKLIDSDKTVNVIVNDENGNKIAEKFFDP